MMSRGHGRIINVGGFADLVPVSNSSTYAASKDGRRALTKTIGADMGNDYPDIFCVKWIPGYLNTQVIYLN